MWRSVAGLGWLFFLASDAVKIESASVNQAAYIPLRGLINPRDSATAWNRQFTAGVHPRDPPQPRVVHKPVAAAPPLPPPKVTNVTQPVVLPVASPPVPVEVKNSTNVTNVTVDVSEKQLAPKVSEKQPAPRVGRILAKHFSDKASNGYGDFYDLLLRDHKYEHLKILEIGLGTLKSGAPSSMTYLPAGTPYKRDASLYALREYFPNAEVFGIDVQDDVMLTNESHILTALADSTSPVAMASAMSKFDCKSECFDVIIEDALHTEKAQLATLKNAFGQLKPGGIYVAEDVQPGYKSQWNIHKDRITNIVGEHSSIVFVDDFRDAKSGKSLHASGVMIVKKAAAAQ